MRKPSTTGFNTPKDSGSVCVWEASMRPALQVKWMTNECNPGQHLSTAKLKLPWWSDDYPVHKSCWKVVHNNRLKYLQTPYPIAYICTMSFDSKHEMICWDDLWNADTPKKSIVKYRTQIQSWHAVLCKERTDC